MLPSSRRPSVATETLSPEERELRLKQWLQRKELLDKGLEVGPHRHDPCNILTLPSVSAVRDLRPLPCGYR